MAFETSWIVPWRHNRKDHILQALPREKALAYNISQIVSSVKETQHVMPLCSQLW